MPARLALVAAAAALGLLVGGMGGTVRHILRSPADYPFLAERVPLPHHVPPSPGGPSLRFAAVHDTIHERYARPGDAPPPGPDELRWRAAAVEFRLAAAADPALLRTFDWLGHRLDAGIEDLLHRELNWVDTGYGRPTDAAFSQGKVAAEVPGYFAPGADPADPARWAEFRPVRRHVTRVGAERGWAAVPVPSHREPVPFDEPTLAILGQWRRGGPAPRPGPRGDDAPGRPAAPGVGGVRAGPPAVRRVRPDRGRARVLPHPLPGPAGGHRADPVARPAGRRPAAGVAERQPAAAGRGGGRVADPVRRRAGVRGGLPAGRSGAGGVPVRAGGVVRVRPAGGDGRARRRPATGVGGVRGRAGRPGRRDADAAAGANQPVRSRPRTTPLFWPLAWGGWCSSTGGRFRAASGGSS